MTDRSTYFQPLGLIRFLLAMGVVMFHYALDFQAFTGGWHEKLIRHSAFRVSFFFFISGFVMSLVYGQSTVSPRTFYLKRATRILPLYLLGFLITIALVVGVKHAAPKGLVIILHGLLLQSWYPGFVLDLNFPAWSISVEMFFYLLFPFMMNFMMRISNVKLLLFTIALWVLQTFQYFWFVNDLSDGSKRIEEFINTFPLWHLVTFICGMTCARLLSHEGFAARISPFAWILLFGGLATLACIIFIPNPLLPYIHNGLLVPAFASIITGLYCNHNFFTRMLNGRLVHSLGDLSYSIFLFQYPVMLTMKAITSTSFQTHIAFYIIYLATLLAMSFVIHNYVEKPTLKRLRERLIDRQRLSMK